MNVGLHLPLNRCSALSTLLSDHHQLILRDDPILHDIDSECGRIYNFVNHSNANGNRLCVFMIKFHTRKRKLCPDEWM